MNLNHAGAQGLSKLDGMGQFGEIIGFNEEGQAGGAYLGHRLFLQ